MDVCVDGEYIDALRDVKLMWKGSSNQKVIDVQATLKSGDKTVPILHCADYYDSPITDAESQQCKGCGD